MKQNDGKMLEASIAEGAATYNIGIDVYKRQPLNSIAFIMTPPTLMPAVSAAFMFKPTARTS